MAGNRVPQEPERGDGEHGDDEDFTCYLSESLLQGLQRALKDAREVTREQVKALTVLDDLDDDAMVVPIDMKFLHSFEDENDMLEKLGAKGAAQAFVEAWESFSLSQEKKGVPKNEQPTSMTAKEWKAVLAMEDEETCAAPPVLTDEQVKQLFGEDALDEIAGSCEDEEEERAAGEDLNRLDEEEHVQEGNDNQILNNVPVTKKARTG